MLFHSVGARCVVAELGAYDEVLLIGLHDDTSPRAITLGVFRDIADVVLAFQFFGDAPVDRWVVAAISSNCTGKV